MTRCQAHDPACDSVEHMSEELTTENRETGTRHRSPLTWAVAAAAVLLILAVVVFGFLVLRDDPEPAAPPTAHGADTVTELGAPDDAAYAARCLVPNAETLASQTVAFDGTVTAIADDSVTLAPTHWYAGKATDLVRVRAPSEQMQRLVGAVRFEDGGRFLVSATDGRLTLCGFTAAYTPELAALYEQAFAS
jgi:hypothetical protein